MVLEKLVTQGNGKDFLVGLGRGYLDIPNSLCPIKFCNYESRTIREEQGRALGHTLFLATGVAVLFSSIIYYAFSSKSL